MLNSQQSVAVKADDALITPVPITLYDENDAEITSYNEWMRDTLEAAAPPFFNRTDVGDWFASWNFLTKENTVFMGLGVDRPAAVAGAVFAKAEIRDNDRTQLSIEIVPVSNRLDGDDQPVSFLDEDGFYEMQWLDDERIVIAGTDPAYDDNSSPAGGNLYTYNLTNNTMTKTRCVTGNQYGDCGDTEDFIFPNIMHFFGISVLGQSVYLSGSVPDPTNSDPVVYKSTDLGQNWEEVAIIDDQWFRGIDIFAFQDEHSGQTRENVVMAVNNKMGIWANNAILYSNDQGSNQAGVDWEQITENIFQFDNDSVHTNLKATMFQGTPLYVEGYYNYNSLYHLKKNGSGVYEPIEVSLGSLTLGTADNSSPNFQKYNVLVGTEEWVYILADDNALYKSDLSEPVTWTKISQFEEADHIVSIHYWEEQDSIIASSRGLDARLFLVPFSEPAPDPTPSPSPTINDEVNTAADTTVKIIKAIQCAFSTPVDEPDLFAINRQRGNVVLNFTPVKGATGYYVSYGLDSNIHQFGTFFDWSDSSGVIQYPIYDLDPTKTYSFSVRAQNMCQPGEWSKIKTSKP